MAQCAAQANCLAPTPSSYGIERASNPDPIIAAIETTMEIIPFRVTNLNRTGLRKKAAALTAVNATEPPKYA